VSRAFVWIVLLLAGCAAFPANEAAQLALRDYNDEAGMRAHGWALLARVADTRLEGWHGLGETFPSGRGRFRLVEEPDSAGVPLLQASGAPLLSSVLFNDVAFNHIRARRLFSRARLTALNTGFDGATPLADRQIAPFPRGAMALKTIWAVVHAGGPTRLSVWDGGGDPVHANFPVAWPRQIIVDPAGATPGAVPLARFHHLRIGAAELAAVRAIDSSAQAGDWLVLLALHITTKEIPDWVWATWWWHDRPDAGPFAAGRTPALIGPWRNYLMDISYSADTPREADGTQNIAFNPWIEVFPAGTRSNCAACHQGAVWTPSGAPPFLPVRRGARAPDDPLFRTGTRLDFMWSIATEAR
jgi:hypothetical protein